MFLEHWEVFTQALRDVYPRKISDPEYTEHKAVVQLLLENNANSQRPSTLYEMVCRFLLLLKRKVFTFFQIAQKFSPFLLMTLLWCGPLTTCLNNSFVMVV